MFQRLAKAQLGRSREKKKNESDEITGKHYPIKALQDFWMEVWPGDKARVFPLVMQGVHCCRLKRRESSSAGSAALKAIQQVCGLASRIGPALCRQ